MLGGMFRMGGKYPNAFFMGTLPLERRRAREEVGGFVLFLFPTLSALLHLLGILRSSLLSLGVCGEVFVEEELGQ